ncbi:hypothetical protein Tco_0766470 [Tanacetum coccineum]
MILTRLLLHPTRFWPLVADAATFAAICCRNHHTAMIPSKSSPYLHAPPLSPARPTTVSDERHHHPHHHFDVITTVTTNTTMLPPSSLQPPRPRHQNNKGALGLIKTPTDRGAFGVAVATQGALGLW